MKNNLKARTDFTKKDNLKLLIREEKFLITFETFLIDILKSLIKECHNIGIFDQRFQIPEIPKKEDGAHPRDL